MNQTEPNNYDPSVWKQKSLEALQELLGAAEEDIFSYEATDEDGQALDESVDVICFKNKFPGVIATTWDRIGDDEQFANDQGNYELMICTREASEWALHVISQLALYTHEEPIEPGDTMDLDGALPEGSNLSALLFLDYARFKVLERDAGLLLCVGITADELEEYQNGDSNAFIEKLQDRGVYPYTDLNRESIAG